jgi:hypothetical protein
MKVILILEPIYIYINKLCPSFHRVVKVFVK